MAALNLDSAEQLFADAFRLAHFIHAERSVALKIASSALAKLEVAATAQDKRLYYRPRNSPRGKRDDFRTKVSLTERQLLQRLVYIESEPYEKETERRAGGVQRHGIALKSSARKSVLRGHEWLPG